MESSNLEIAVKELTNEDLILVTGGGFAYDIGIFLREMAVNVINGGNYTGAIAIAEDLGQHYRPIN
jgi:hypothetical protein